MPKKVIFNNPPLTKKRFMSLLKKAATPVSEWKHGQVGKETSTGHHPDGCTETHKSQDNPEGKGG